MKTTDFERLAGEFARSQKARHLKNRTISETQRMLARFFRFLALQGITHVDHITREVVRAYQVDIYEYINPRGRPNSVSYQNSQLSVVKRFLKFMQDTGHIVSDPAAIPYAKEPKRLPRSILTVSEARKILHAPDTKSVLGYRDRTILEVLYSTGIRKTELRNLTLNDVDYHDGFLRVVKGKGNKDRVVPLGRIACRYLENYIKIVRPELIRDPYNNHVFLSLRGNKINQNMVWTRIKKYARKAKIRKNVHCHTFRHTCATAMLKNKADIRVIQELLGHSCLNTTQIYTHISINDLKEIHRQCHPRERDKE